jgi:hypothetical protein
MLALFRGLLVCSLLLVSVAHAADGNREVFSPWAAAPSCPSGKACMFLLASDGQLYAVDANAVTTKVHSAKAFRTSANCASLASPANGDVCYDTTLAAFRYYSAGWRSASAVGQITGGAAGALGAAATIYLRAPGMAPTGTVETELSVATRTATVRNLYCHLGVAPGGADTVINTVRLNATNLSLACTITGAAVSCNDTSNYSAISAGDRLTVKSVSSAGTASDLACSFEVTY